MSNITQLMFTLDELLITLLFSYATCTLGGLLMFTLQITFVYGYYSLLRSLQIGFLVTRKKTLRHGSTKFTIIYRYIFSSYLVLNIDNKNYATSNQHIYKDTSINAVVFVLSNVDMQVVQFLFSQTKTSYSTNDLKPS